MEGCEDTERESQEGGDLAEHQNRNETSPRLWKRPQVLFQSSSECEETVLLIEKFEFWQVVPYL